VIAPFSTEEAVVAGPLLAAVEEVVAASSTSVRVVACDDGREPARAADAVGGLIAGGGCIGVVGPKNGGSALAAAPVAGAAGLPLVLPCATADELTSEGGVVFRLCAPDSATAAAAVALAVELAVQRLAVIPDDTAYGQGLARVISAAAGPAGISVSGSADGTSAAFLAMGEVEQAVLMQSLRRDGYDGVFLSAEGGPGAPVVELAAGAAEGAFLLYPGTPVEGRSVYTAEAADAARVLLAAAGGGANAIRTTAVDGETGPIRFSATGEREGLKVARYQVVDGHARLLPDAPIPRTSVRL
jgi:ABC-type branched-subunit amino acid transport system substrate-binding protein